MRERAIVHAPGLGGRFANDQRAAASDRRVIWTRLAVLLEEHWPVVAVLLLYAGSALVVPTLAPVAIGDDWVYIRSVEILLRQHELKILDLAVVTLVFQVAWGALFAALFGLTFGVLRVSTVVLVGLGGLACYGLCRELGVARGRSALGAAAYLFNPLAYVLGFTFMTDAPFTALLVIATFFYTRGLRPDAPRVRMVLAGSVVAALAFLVRQQGALIPLAVVLYLIASHRLRLNRAGVALALQVAAFPALTTILYYLWLRFIHGVPLQQESFFTSLREAGWGGTWQLTGWLTFIAAMYLGLFALPLALATVPRLPFLIRTTPSTGWVLVCLWEALLVAGVVIHAQPGNWPASLRMPYIPQYLNPWQLGPPDILGGRPLLFADPAVLDWVTGVCLAASLLFALILARQVRADSGPDRAGAGLVFAVGLWQLAGLLPPSYHFRTWAVSMDRYLLPLVPIAAALGLWALRDVWLPLPLAWLALAALALFAVAGTHDLLVFQQATWGLAAEANRLGVPNTKLDAGAAWDGYYLWEYSDANHIPPQTPAGRPWWTDLFAPATDSSYVVATVPLPGYTVVQERDYSAWLLPGPAPLYLLHRQNTPKPA